MFFTDAHHYSSISTAMGTGHFLYSPGDTFLIRTVSRPSIASNENYILAYTMGFFPLTSEEGRAIGFLVNPENLK